MHFLLLSVVVDSILWDHQLYLCGDNDLEYFSIQDLNEARSAFTSNSQLASSIRFTVLFDRAKSNVRNAVDDPLPNLYRSNGQASSEGSFSNTKLVRFDSGVQGWKEVNDMGTFNELNTADPNTLADFIAQTMDTSATNHFLEFWNHGAAYVGFGVDESVGNHALLSLEDIYDGIKAGLNRVSITKYTIIGFDACLMSNFVVAAALGQFTDYFLFSEEVEPGYGWNYAGLNAGTDAKSYTTNMIDEFFDYGTQNPRTLCLLSVTKFNTFKQAFDAMITFAMRRLDDYDVDVYNAIQRAGTYAKSVEGAGIDLGQFLEKLQSFLPPECNSPTYFDLDSVRQKYAQMFEHQRNSDPRYTGMSIYWPGSSYLTNTYKRLPSKFGHSTWYDLIQKLSSVRDNILNNGVKGYCLTGTNNRWDGKNFTMTDYASSRSSDRVQLQATISSNAGETYADYGIEVGSKVTVYGSTDGTITEQGSGDDKSFRLRVEWDTFGTYLKENTREVLIFSYVTYREDGKMTITAPLYYFPSGVTPQQDTNGNYDVRASAGAREATLYITVDSPPSNGVEFTLYSASSNTEGAPKAEVALNSAGTIVVASYENTFSNFHRSNTVKYIEKLDWKTGIEVVRKSVSGVQTWYMRAVAVTGDMLVYTTKKVTAQGATTATGPEQLVSYPGSNSVASSSNKSATDSVGGAGGIVGMVFGVIVIGALVMIVGKNPSEAIAMADSFTGGMVSSMLGGGGEDGDFEAGDGEIETTGGLDMKEAVRPAFE